MNTVVSKDGTTIAYDKTGEGPAVILVGGAFSYRKFPGSVKLAGLLSQQFTVYNYDRRGRGESTDMAPYHVAREVEDLQALLVETGPAYVFGMSSGGVLALRAAAAGLPIKKLAVYQPPFLIDASRPLPPVDFTERLQAMLDRDARGDAVKWFMTKGMGVPAFVMLLMRFMSVWPKLKAVAHTLPYDFAVMRDSVKGKPLSPQEWAPVTVPTLVIDGAKSSGGVGGAAQALVDVLPAGERRTLAGQNHDVSMDVLAPVLLDFFKHSESISSR